MLIIKENDSFYWFEMNVGEYQENGPGIYNERKFDYLFCLKDEIRTLLIVWRFHKIDDQGIGS